MSRKLIITARLDGKVTIRTHYVPPSKTGRWISNGQNAEHGFWVSRRMVDLDVYDHITAIVRSYYTDSGISYFRRLISTGFDVATARHQQMVAEFDAAMMAYTFGGKP